MYTESDWKRFRTIVPMLRERYLAERNKAIVAALTDPAKCETDCFWNAHKKVEETAKILYACLDGHSRSKMPMFVAMMLHSGMMKREDIPGFSEGFQKDFEFMLEKRSKSGS